MHGDIDIERLEKQVGFILEIDKLKHVLRRSVTIDPRRRENDSEHSWHLGVMAVLLAEYVRDESLDLTRVLQMVLVHDAVEIDAGDTYCYDEDRERDRVARERRAADRIFNMLPADQAEELRHLWDEFEERSTPEARFAAALDRLQPLLLNYHSKGLSWQHHGVSREQVLERNRPIEASCPSLWRFAVDLIDDAVSKGYLTP